MSSTVRGLTYLIFIYTCVEGLVVNLLYPRAWPFIVKDVMITVLYLVMLTEVRPRSPVLPKIVPPLVVFALVTLAYLAIPTPLSLLSEAVAIKQKLFYIPLIFVGYCFMRDERDLFALFRVMAWTVIPVSLFGIYLFWRGPTMLQALGGGYSAIFFSTVGQHGQQFWRVPGTFTSPGQYGAFLMVNSIMLTAVLLVRGLPQRDRVITAVALGLAILASLTSGSRTPLLLYFVGAGFVLMTAGRLKGIGTAAFLIYAVVAVGFSYFGQGVADRVGSILSFEHVSRLQGSYFGQAFIPRLLSDPLGGGLGIATIGARHFSEWTQVKLVESYLGLLVYEMGGIGLGVFVWASLTILARIWGWRRAMQRSALKPIWYAFLFFSIMSLSLTPVSTGLDAAPGNLYFWFFIGTAARLHDLERARSLRRAGPAPAPAPPPPQRLLPGAARQGAW